SGATLAVNVPPAITLQPTNVTVLVGSNAALVVAATGTAPLTYQWQFNGTNILGANSRALTLTNLQHSDGGLYSALVSNVAGSAASDAALLDVRYVFVFGSGQFLSGTNYTYIGSVTIALESGFENGSIFYSL